MSAVPRIPAFDPRISNLVHSLCQGRRLPAELSDMIACHLDTADYVTISTLSHGLRQQANAIIYHEIVIDMTTTIDLIKQNSAILLLRTMSTSGSVISHVRHLLFLGFPLEDWRYRNSSRPEAELEGHDPPDILYDMSMFSLEEMQSSRTRTATSLPWKHCWADGDINMPALCLAIIGLPSTLESLQVNSDYFRYPDFRAGLEKMADEGKFRALKSTTLCSDLRYDLHLHQDAVEKWTRTLMFPFMTPAMNSVKVFMCLPLEMMTKIRTTPITRLMLCHYQPDDFDLDSLLAATPRLIYLEYYANVEVFWLRDAAWRVCRYDAETRPLFKSLHHVEDTLEHLVIGQDIVTGCTGFEPGPGVVWQRYPPELLALTKLKRLHTLSIPYPTLLGWQENPQRNPDWDKCLPTTIRNITWTDRLMEFFDEDFWEAKTLMPVLSTLLDWLSCRTTEKVSLKFCLQLDLSEGDFRESEQQQIRELCRIRGISCMIQMNFDKDLRTCNPWRW